MVKLSKKVKKLLIEHFQSQQGLENFWIRAQLCQMAEVRVTWGNASDELHGRPKRYPDEGKAIRELTDAYVRVYEEYLAGVALESPDTLNCCSN